MSTFWQRLKCQHYYIKDGWNGLYGGKNIDWHCVDCDKKILLKPGRSPINPIRETNQQYYQRMIASGNAHLVMRPTLGMEGEPKL